MPSKRKPETLEHLCLKRVVNHILYSCEGCSWRHSQEIREYVLCVPATIGSKFVTELLTTAMRKYPHRSEVNLRDAFHPKCSEIDLSMSKVQLSSVLYRELFKNLDVFSGLEMFDSGSRPARHDERFAKDMMDMHAAKLKNLRILQAPLPDNPAAILKLVKSSSLLERVSTCYLSPSQTRIFVACANLKVLRHTGTYSLSPDDIIHMLDNLHCLESIHVTNFRALLAKCKGTYPLKDFGGAHVDSRLLGKLVQHFPQLETLNVNHSNACLKPLNDLRCLKVLGVACVKTSAVCSLVLPCLAHLTKLALTDVKGLSVIFNDGVNESFRLSSLVLSGCTDVDLTLIRRVFPHLRHLQLASSSLVTFRSSPSGWKCLEDFRVTRGCSGWSQDHLVFVVSTCFKLKRLHLDASHFLSDSIFRVLLATNPMNELRSVFVNSDRLTGAVLVTVANSFESLSEASLTGGILKQDLTQELRGEVTNALKLYEMTSFNVCGTELYK